MQEAGGRSWHAALLLGGALVALLLAGSAPVSASGSLPGQPANCSSGLVLSTSQMMGLAPLSVSFQLTVYWGVPVTVHWSFGDGAYLNGSGPGFFQPAHTYSSVGTYEMIVSVASGTRTGACSIGVEAMPPTLVVRPGVDVSSGLAPLTVHLGAQVSGGSGTYEDAGWSFGDGYSANGFNLTHTYTIPGTYSATFTVVDTLGDRANGSETIHVLAQLPGPTHSTISAGTLSLFGAAVLGIVGSAGAFLYVGTRPLKFSDRRRSPRTPPEDDLTPALIDTHPILPDGDAPSISESTELVPLSIAFPPAAYRGVFLDLSDQEFVTTVATEISSRSPVDLASVPPGETQLSDGVPPRSPRPGGLSLSQRVLVHLAAHPRLGPNDTATQPFTQAGMGEALGVQQSTLSNALRRLEFSGLLHQQTDHVIGVARRVRIYSLTPKGELIAQKLKLPASAIVSTGRRPGAAAELMPSPEDSLVGPPDA
ncbi:MAG: PKD domain-containing protein [Thermoplasmata archaeon]